MKGHICWEREGRGHDHSNDTDIWHSGLRTHKPRLWKGVCAFLQQQLWDQRVQNLRTGPLSIPETHTEADTQAIKQKGEIKGLSNNLDLVGFKWKKHITERKRDPAELSTGEIIIWSYDSACPHVKCPIMSSVKSEHSQTETLLGQTGVASQVVLFPFSVRLMISRAGALVTPGG